MLYSIIADAVSINAHEQPAVFRFCRFPLFQQNPFFRLFSGRNSCHFAVCSWLKSLITHLYNADIFIIWDYWVLRESRISLKSMLVGCESTHMNRLNRLSSLSLRFQILYALSISVGSVSRLFSQLHSSPIKYNQSK